MKLKKCSKCGSTRFIREMLDIVEIKVEKDCDTDDFIEAISCNYRCQNCDCSWRWNE